MFKSLQFDFHGSYAKHITTNEVLLQEAYSNVAFNHLEWNASVILLQILQTNLQM